MITRLAILRLAPSASLANPSTPASKTLAAFLAPELAAPGCKFAYYGTSDEKPELGFVFVGWESLEKRGEFEASSYVLTLTL